MHIDQQKEQFSRAYTHAVATVAGYALYQPSVDDDSIDLGIASSAAGGTVRSPRVEAQIKCTSAYPLATNHLSYPLKLKNYDDLRDAGVLVPRILIVVVVPSDPAAWLEHSDEQLILKHCGYWLSLRGLSASSSQAADPRVTVQLPRRQPLNVQELQGIMNRIGAGGFP
jgi:hypothetical protein